MYSSPAVADGKVYIASVDNKLYCFDATTGAFNWSFTTGGNPTYGDIWSSPAVACGVVYIYSADRHIYAFGTEYFIPESFTVTVVVLLSTVSVALSFWLLRKKPKWKNSIKKTIGEHNQISNLLSFFVNYLWKTNVRKYLMHFFWTNSLKTWQYISS